MVALALIFPSHHKPSSPLYQEWAPLGSTVELYRRSYSARGTQPHSGDRKRSPLLRLSSRVAVVKRGSIKVRWTVALQARDAGRRVVTVHSVGDGQAFHQAGGFTHWIITPARVVAQVALLISLGIYKYPQGTKEKCFEPKTERKKELTNELKFNRITYCQLA